MRGTRKILLRGVNRIGDTVFSLPAVRALRRGFPGAEITALVKPQVAALLESVPEIDRVLLFDTRGPHRGPGGRLRLVRRLRREGFDLAVLFHNSLETALIAFLAGIPERVGYVKELRGPLLTRKRPFPREPVDHAVHYLDLVSLLGVPVEGGLLPELRVASGDRAYVRRLLGDPPRPLVALIPGSLAETRRWFPDRFAATADRLLAEKGGTVVIVGGSGDRGVARRVTERMKREARDLTGRLDLRQSMALLAESDLVISNDTGPMHLAWAVGARVITFFGAADLKQHRPKSPKVTILRRDIACSPCIRESCPQGHLACLEGITVDEVVEEALRILS